MKNVTVVAQTHVTYGGKAYGAGMQISMPPEDADQFIKSKEVVSLKEAESAPVPPPAPKPVP